MTTHINTVPTFLGLALLIVAWRLDIFDDAANRRAGVAAGATGLVLIPVMEYTRLHTLGNYVQLTIVVCCIAVVTAGVRFGGPVRP